MPAPVATRRREEKRGVRARKFWVGGLRIQRVGGGALMMVRVQSPAWETMMVAEVVSGEGVVAKACHSSRGERENLTVEV